MLVPKNKIYVDTNKQKLFLIPTNKKLDLPLSGVSATPVNPPVGERPRQPGIFHSMLPFGVSAFASLRGVPLAPSLLEKES